MPHNHAYKVEWKEASFRYKFVYMGTKGDWPFLRTSLKLRTGWNCFRICHLCNEPDSLYFLIYTYYTYKSKCPVPSLVAKEWWNLKGNNQRLPRDTIPEDPYKADKAPSPLRLLSGGSNPLNARVDPAHTWAIAGVG